MSVLPKSAAALIMVGVAAGCAATTLGLVGAMLWPHVVLTPGMGRVLGAVLVILAVMYGFYRSIMRGIERVERELRRLGRYDRYDERLSVVRDG